MWKHPRPGSWKPGLKWTQGKRQVCLDFCRNDLNLEYLCKSRVSSSSKTTRHSLISFSILMFLLRYEVAPRSDSEGSGSEEEEEEEVCNAASDCVCGGGAAFWHPVLFCVVRRKRTTSLRRLQLKQKRRRRSPTPTVKMYQKWMSCTSLSKTVVVLYNYPVFITGWYNIMKFTWIMSFLLPSDTPSRM